MTLAEIGTFVDASQWDDDGYIYFGSFQKGIERIPESGGAAEKVLPEMEDLIDYHGLVTLPGTDALLTLPHLGDGEPTKIFIEQPGKETRVLYQSDSTIQGVFYSPTGHVLFYREDNPRGLWAVSFSLSKLEIAGDPFLVVPDLDRVSLSAAGDMVYTRKALHGGKEKRQIVWTDRDGEIVDRLDVDLYETRTFSLSPDGTKVALMARGVGRPSTDRVNLWVLDLERGSSTKLTEGRAVAIVPSWSPDGNRVGYLQDADEPGGEKRFISLRADGTGDEETVFEADVTFFTALSADWSMAAFMHGTLGEANGVGISVMEADAGASANVFVDGPHQEIAPAIHPSGKWLAYGEGDFRAMDIIVRPFPEGEGQWKASAGGSNGLPMWSPDGDRLYHVLQRKLIEVTFDGSGAQPVIGRPVELFEIPDESMQIAGADRFAFIVDQEPEEGEEAPNMNGIILVENWLSRFEK